MAGGDSRRITRHEREVADFDRRWLATWIASFVGLLVLFAGAYGVYKLTGPHPSVTLFLRSLRHEVRWLIPGLKRRPNAHADAVGLEADDLRHAAVDLPRR